ncbi:DUF6143 family protein [Heliophilum fasciatum]|nr:DUF6143 family protein [Heliophilum fasciatum]MCW2279396.1 hypothetical protein [Heliophilum fasciatum]
MNLDIFRKINKINRKVLGRINQLVPANPFGITNRNRPIGPSDQLNPLGPMERPDQLNLPVKVVDWTFSVWETLLGNYFFGQTEMLTFGDGYNAWGALINPTDSGVDMFWNVYTFSNFSSQPFTAEVWANSMPPGQGIVSKNIASANQMLNPPPMPKITLQYGDRVLQSPTQGIYAFTRIVEPKATLTRHDFQGMIIIPPGGSVITYLRSPGKGNIQSRIAFGWWEQDSSINREMVKKLTAKA